MSARQGSALFLKRCTDLFLAVPALLVLAPFLAVIAVLIRLDSRGPALFRQERAGQECRVFRICKFRTMVDGAARIGLGVFTETDDPRLTRIGRWLRRWSLDELPQLFNILRGEMSIVGPRPTLPYQVANYDAHQRKRLRMRPGLTGWAQINGRNSLSWPERIQLDLWYIEHWSLRLDWRIMLRTPPVVLGRKGVYGQPMDEISATGPRA